MSETVYDLGEIAEAGPPRAAATARPVGRNGVAATAAAPSAPVAPIATEGFDLPAALSVVLPGAGHALRGRLAVGVFFLTWLAFLATLAWAIATNVDRLAHTLPFLGVAPAAAMWTVVAIYWLAALTHVASVVSATAADGKRGSSHPLVAGVASMLVPGWGQAVNGDWARAGILLTTVWVIGACWLLATPFVAWWLGRLELVLPGSVLMLSSPVVRWTVPAVVWTLAIYDAVSSASRR